jgi:hypothetical protein
MSSEPEVMRPTEQELCKRLALAMIEDPRTKTWEDVSKITNIPASYLRKMHMELRWGSLTFPEDFVAICKALHLSADDILGLQEQAIG